MHRVIARSLLLTMLAASAIQGQTPRGETDWQVLRNHLVDEVLVPGGITNQRVLSAIRTTPRHEFIPRHLRRHAYFDMALPIGDSQTISSPFIVAFMTECIDPQPDERVLEIGTGSGYQAAVLSPLAAKVYSIEIVQSLGRRAERTLRRLRLNNVSVKIGDGFEGWPEHAPFDKIIVTCSPESVPQALTDQLRDGGRMVIPVGERYQQAMVLLRKKEGKLERESLRPTLFVPMTGKDAEQSRIVKPDVARLALVNGSFEDNNDESEFALGWYYQRQASRVTTDDAPDGENYMLFENATRGRHSHVMQGMALDGRTISRIRISSWGRAESIRSSNAEGPRVILTFYDENRRDLGQWWLGPWPSDGVWRREQKEIRVPPVAREAIVRIGLFGATGMAAFDSVQVTAMPTGVPRQNED